MSCFAAPVGVYLSVSLVRNFSSISLRVFFYFSIVHQGVYGFAHWGLQQEDIAKVFAGTEYRNRPQLTALLETAKRGEFDIVIIRRFQPFSKETNFYCDSSCCTKKLWCQNRS